ncbi:ABC transporter ATP-binding protein [Lacrimispora sp.]|uniref:ABC transporter ATP-binding protein n=1 Tax=Lacrimispora sp. TaxID=2719234 RepID=UPI0032E442B7
MNKKEFKLREKRYGWVDFFAIPFACDSQAAAALGVQKMLTALSAVFQVAVLARFLDSADLALKSNGQWNSVFVWFAILAVCVGWRRISFRVGVVFTERIRICAAAQMNRALTEKRSRLSYYLVENEESWNLINRVSKQPERQITMMLQRSYNLILYVIRIFGVLYIVFTQVWWIGILTAVLCIPLIILSLKTGEKNYNAKKLVADHERRYQYLANVLSGREAVNERTLFGYSEKLNGDWYEQYEEARLIKWRANLKLACSVRGGSAVITILSSFIVIALLFPVSSGQISTGMFIALATGMYDLVNMVGVELTKAVSQLSQCREYLKDLSAFVALEEVPGVDEPPVKEPVEIKEVEFRDVSFSYPGSDHMILNHLSFRVERGAHYAFVGANGAGKTTITKLLTGLYHQYEGEILINKKELRTFSQPQIKAMFCGLYQDFAKYYISIKENIAVGAAAFLDKAEKTDEIEDALKTAGIYDEICNLPHGIDTNLGKIRENGVDFSGGQWQKLAMARAVNSKAPILILDEPTAALDPISESRVYEEFENISRGRTTLFISHRLGSTRLAHQIFVLADGHIEESGNHEELMEQNGLYAEMFESQRRWYQ